MLGNALFYGSETKVTYPKQSAAQIIEKEYLIAFGKFSKVIIFNLLKMYFIFVLEQFRLEPLQECRYHINRCDY